MTVRKIEAEGPAVKAAPPPGPTALHADERYQGPGHSSTSVLRLQRSLGNRGTTQLLREMHQTPAQFLHPLTLQLDRHKSRLPDDRGVILEDGTSGEGALAFNEKGRELPTPVSFGAINARGYGTVMSGYIYDWNHWPEGSVPTVVPPWWPSKQSAGYKKRNAKVCTWFSRYMVQGHLLNHNMGGPGNDMRNLAPISKRANKEHLLRVEEAAKELHIEHDEALSYKVTVIPGPPRIGSFDKFISKLIAAERPEAERLVKRLPMSFQCELQKCRLDGTPLPAFVSYNVLNLE